MGPAVFLYYLREQDSNYRWHPSLRYFEWDEHTLGILYPRSHNDTDRSNFGRKTVPNNPRNGKLVFCPQK